MATNLAQEALLFGAGLLGGAINSVAGGGSFICFPALLLTGMPAIPANATNTLALWPGTVASMIAYRGTVAEEWRKPGQAKLFIPLIMLAIGGSVAGALLLLHTPARTFVKLIPWFMLMATLLLGFGRRLTEHFRLHQQSGRKSWAAQLGIIAFQLAIALYVGYFGAGAGIVTLALLAVVNMEHIHSMNGIKSLLVGFANGVAIITFIFAHVIWWRECLVMLIGGVLGGYGMGWFAQRLDPSLVRSFVIVVAVAMTAYFFWKYYLAGPV